LKSQGNIKQSGEEKEKTECGSISRRDNRGKGEEGATSSVSIDGGGNMRGKNGKEGNPTKSRKSIRWIPRARMEGEGRIPQSNMGTNEQKGIKKREKNVWLRLRQGKRKGPADGMPEWQMSDTPNQRDKGKSGKSSG